MKIVMDVDTGTDNALALLLAGQAPELDILAVTCVAGNADVTQVATNTLDVLEIAGLGPVPVACGARRPLINQASAASYVHGRNGIADLDLAGYGASGRGRPDPRHAIELLRDVLLDSDDPVTVIALAPLTNLALFLRTYPDLASRIERIAVMGGGYGLGNATATAEFNIWHDPEAAAVCFDSGVPVLLYGLDVFYDVRLTADDLTRLRSTSTQEARLAADLCDWLSRVYAAEPRVARSPYVTCLGDAGLLAALLAPSALGTVRYPVRIALADPLTRGQTVVDRRWNPGSAAFLPIQFETPQLDVAVSVDAHRCATEFLSRFGVR